MKVGDKCQVWGDGEVVYTILEIVGDLVFLSGLGGWKSRHSLSGIWCDKKKNRLEKIEQIL